ncbi:MAG: transposase [Bdellovibrionota bacterium]
MIAADIHESAADYGGMKPLVNQVQENTGEQPESYLMDSGYQSLENIKKVEDVGSTAYISRKRQKAQAEQELNEQIRKGEEDDRTYYCLDDRKMDLASRNSNGTLSFRMTKSFCLGDKQDKCSFYGKS